MTKNEREEIFRDALEAAAGVLDKRAKALPKSDGAEIKSFIRKQEYIVNFKMRTIRPMDPPARMAYSKQDTARMMSVSEMTINRWLKDGRLPCVKIGGRVLITPDGMRKMLCARENAN